MQPGTQDFGLLKITGGKMLQYSHIILYPPVSVCMCSCYAYMCPVYIQKCSYTCESKKLTSGLFPQLLSSLLLRQFLSEPRISVRMTGQGGPGIYLSLLSSALGYPTFKVCACVYMILYVCAGVCARQGSQVSSSTTFTIPLSQIFLATL